MEFRIILFFTMKTYVITLYKNCLNEAVLMGVGVWGGGGIYVLF